MHRALTVHTLCLLFIVSPDFRHSLHVPGIPAGFCSALPALRVEPSLCAPVGVSRLQPSRWADPTLIRVVRLATDMTSLSRCITLRSRDLVCADRYIHVGSLRCTIQRLAASRWLHMLHMAPRTILMCIVSLFLSPFSALCPPCVPFRIELFFRAQPTAVSRVNDEPLKSHAALQRGRAKGSRSPNPAVVSSLTKSTICRAIPSRAARPLHPQPPLPSS